MRKTRRNTPEAFSPENPLNTSPVIDPSQRDLDHLQEDVSVEDVYSPQNDKNKKNKEHERNDAQEGDEGNEGHKGHEEHEGHKGEGEDKPGEPNQPVKPGEPEKNPDPKPKRVGPPDIVMGSEESLI
ncbi:MAG: hypothetical protein ACOYXT_13950 [Bacteroidota bacterium]